MSGPAATVYVVEPDPQARDGLRRLARTGGIDGLEVLRQVRVQRPDLPVIVLAVCGDVALAVRAMRAGATDFVEKPFVDRAVLKQIRRSLEVGGCREGRTP